MDFPVKANGPESLDPGPLARESATDVRRARGRSIVADGGRGAQGDALDDRTKRPIVGPCRSLSVIFFLNDRHGERSDAGAAATGR